MLVKPIFDDVSLAMRLLLEYYSPAWGSAESHLRLLDRVVSGVGFLLNSVSFLSFP